MKPPVTLLLGPGGSAKSDWVAERFLKEGERSLLIVASMPQAQTRSAEIGVKAGREPSEFQGRILPFHALVTLLTPASSQNESRISRAFQRMILAQVVQTNIRPDDFFGAMLEAPGFVNALSERVREWKLAGITPELLAAGSSDAAKLLQAPSFLLKTTELVRLFQAYQDFLKTHLLQDDEDILISSAERLLSDHAKIPAEANVILFDSFYRFTKAQRNLISALSTRLVLNGEGRSEVVVTLPVEASRPLLYAAPLNTLEKFQNEFAVNEVVLPGQSREKPAILNFLSDHLFSPVRETPPHSLLSANSPPALQMIDAPNSYVEAELIAREFVRLHATKEYAWGDFAVILRTMGDYTPILSAVFERYQIPLGVDGPERLLDNPLLRTGHLMLQVFRFGWRRDDVIAFLKSSYIASNKLEVDQLRLRARVKAVRSGKENWLNLVGIDEGEVEELISEFPARVDKSNLNFQIALLASLDSRFKSECRTPSDFVEGMKEALVEFGLEEKGNRGDSTTRERDAQALKEGLEVLNALAQMARIGGRETMAFEEFYTETSREWSAAVSMGSQQKDQVRVSDPFDARQSQIKVAAVMGLTERVFPRRITEDPFFRDDERAALRETSGIELDEMRLQADDERFLFYLAVTAPTSRLLLSYPRSTKESDTLPSFYLDEVRAAFEGCVPSPLTTVTRTLADVAPRMEETVNSSDQLLAACANLFDPGNEAGSTGVDQKIETSLQSLAVSMKNEAVSQLTKDVLNSRRLPSLPRLTSPDLLVRFTEHHDVYPISDLESYARCPLQYLMRTVFKLRPESEGLDSSQQSNLLHTVLRRRFRKQRSQFATSPYAPDACTMTAELKELLATLLESDSLDVSPVQLNILKRKLGEDLENFALREARFGEQFGMTPTHFHLTFGSELVAGRNDSQSTVEPLSLSIGEGGEQVKVSGVIDRIDLDSSGQRALLLDYDTGTPSEFSAILNGTSLQMPLSLFAVERLFGFIGGGACTDSMKESGRRRFFRTEHLNIRQFQPILPLDDAPNVKPLSREQFAELIRTATISAIRTAQKISTGGVEATPGDHCRSCHFRDVCRTSLAEGHDGE